MPFAISCEPPDGFERWFDVKREDGTFKSFEDVLTEIKAAEPPNLLTRKMDDWLRTQYEALLNQRDCYGDNDLVNHRMKVCFLVRRY